jgi:hypothetical protein
MRRRKRPADDLAEFEDRARVLGGLLRVASLLDPDGGRVLGQVRRLRRCHAQTSVLRRRREGEEWRAKEDARHRERQKAIDRSVRELKDRQVSRDRDRRERQAEIRRSLADLHDRLASRDRFAAELERRLTPG